MPAPNQVLYGSPVPSRSPGAVVKAVNAIPMPGSQVVAVPRPMPRQDAGSQGNWLPKSAPDLPRELLVAFDLVKKQRTSPDQRDQAYRCWIQSLAAWGVLENLPLDAQGTLQVTAPFCHDFFEAPHLLPFLASQILDRGRARRIEVQGCDVRPQDFWWGAWEKWTEHEFSGRITLQLRQQDLVQGPQPLAGLILAAHPEVTNGGPWLPILRHVLSSRRSPNGRCVFATFYRQEAEACVQICQAQQVMAEIRENPFYAGRPADEVGTFHRYAVIVAPA